MLNPYYLADRVLQGDFNIALDSHLINHAESKLTIKPNFSEFGTEFRYIKKIMREMAIVYADLKNQNKFK